MSTSEVAVIGAGPYGLAAAAHLRAAGIETQVFGRTMEYWRCNMPKGMLLRSPWRGSHIGGPDGAFTLDEFVRSERTPKVTPIPIDRFIRYGEWFQENAAGSVDHRLVLRIESAAPGYRLLLEDGAQITARRVIVAAGLKDYAYRPSCWNGLPRSFVTHCSEHHDLSKFKNRGVVVIGAGQSALETAALLSESGAQVEVIARKPLLHWLGPAGDNVPHSVLRLARRAALRLSPPGEIGPFPLSWIIEFPGLYRRLGAEAQRRICDRALHASVARWVAPRVRQVRLTLGRSVVAAAVQRDRVNLALDDGTETAVDYVLLATGYKVDVSRHKFLPAELLNPLERVDGSPVLSESLESSLPGLHFLGAASVFSLGPLMRFVWGSGDAARRLVHCVRRNGTKS